MKLKTQMLLFLTTFFGWFILTDSQAQQLSSLKGSWVLDSVSVIQKENGKVLSSDLDEVKKDINLGIFDELIFENENLIASSSDITFSGSVSVVDDQIEYNGAAAPLNYSWKIEEGKLYLIRKYINMSPDKQDVHYNVSLVYIKK